MMTDPMRYLTEERKLDAALLVHLGVKAVDHPQLGAVAAFPYSRDGKPYAYKFRAVDKKDWRSSQGISRSLFNEDCLRGGHGPVVITEGEWLKSLNRYPFEVQSLPAASFNLIQQVGRLIRSHGCWGEVVIYDKRL